MQRTRKNEKQKPYSILAKSLPYGLSIPYPINPRQK